MYYAKIKHPKNDKEGLMNFVQMIINEIEAGNTREALLKAVDLQNDLRLCSFTWIDPNTPRVEGEVEEPILAGQATTQESTMKEIYHRNSYYI